MAVGERRIRSWTWSAAQFNRGGGLDQDRWILRPGQRSLDGWITAGKGTALARRVGRWFCLRQVPPAHPHSLEMDKTRQDRERGSATRGTGSLGL